MALHIASYIDHTILRPTTTTHDVGQICSEALTYGFAAVCVPPYHVKHATTLLQGSQVRIATVIGFPFGYSTTTAKIAEILDAIDHGAQELDVVHNIAALRDGDHDHIKKEIQACTDIIHKYGAAIKVIIESGILTDNEVTWCCEAYSQFNIDMMKTSTGYADVGATVHAVELMRRHLPENIGIKASGGIRNFAFARELIAAGATRLGCSASVQIVKESNE